MKPVPDGWAESIVERLGADGVVVFAFDGDEVAITTAGADDGKTVRLKAWAEDVLTEMRAELTLVGWPLERRDDASR